MLWTTECRLELWLKVALRGSFGLPRTRPQLQAIVGVKIPTEQSMKKIAEARRRSC